MKTYLNKSLWTGFLMLASCQTIGSENEQADSVGVESELLINRSEVIAVTNTRDNANKLEQLALEWGYRLTKKEKLEGLGMFILTLNCPPGINVADAVIELERFQLDLTVSPNYKYELKLNIPQK